MVSSLIISPFHHININFYFGLELSTNITKLITIFFDHHIKKIIIIIIMLKVWIHTYQLIFKKNHLSLFLIIKKNMHFQPSKFVKLFD